MLLRAILQCWSCQKENDIALSGEERLWFCERCTARLLEIQKFTGSVYVLSHPQLMHLKIGQTKLDPFARVRQLNTTGVPGSFKVEAFFPSNKPDRDERKVHDRFAKFHISKEYFDLSVLDAIMKIRSIFNGREPAYLDEALKGDYQERVIRNRQVAAQRFGRKSGIAQAELGPD